MPNMAGRFEWINKLARSCLIVFIALAALAGTAIVAKIVFVGFGDDAKLSAFGRWMQLLPWILALIGDLLAVTAAFMLYGLVKVFVANEAGVYSSLAKLRRVETLLSREATGTEKLLELASLSDRARGLIYRDREIEALSEAVHHDIMRQDYKSAETLINTLDNEFGYVDEAARLRGALESSRKGTRDEQIDSAVKRIQEIIDARDWSRAMRESKRLITAFADSPKVTALPERIETACARHKRSLLQAYGDAVRKKDIDRGIELLKELDAYVTPQEAAALQESARGVFRAKLHNLGVQFAISVTDKSWAEAVVAGEQIMKEYPNSRMAQEVSEKMELLRSRAGEQA